MKVKLLAIILSLYVIPYNVSAQFNLPNPILAGFYPDPSICKVGTDYYIVNSTFSYFPGIPVLHSKDLKNWKQIGNVISNPSQMDFMGEGVSRGLFAPSINYHNGLFYVTCTDIDHDGNFVVTATNPAGPWSKPILLKNVHGIDPSLFFDEDENKAYIVYNSNPPANKPLYDGHRTLQIQEFDPINLKTVGEEKLLVNGGVDISKKPVWIEGPHIYKREGWYYLMAAEGGTAVNHSEVVLRSKNVFGPYIAYDKNPILTQRHLDPNRKNPITSTGHADLVEGPDGNTYAVFIAVRPYEDDFYNTGRETFIAPVKWEDGWPIINPDFEEVQYQYPVTWKEQKDSTALPLTGNFNYKINFKDSLNLQFLFLRTYNPSWFNLNKKDGSLKMQLLPETVLEKGNPAFIAKRQQHLTSNASTALKFSAKAENEKAGLLIFQNETHFYYLCKSVAANKPVVQLFKANSSSNTMELIKQEPINFKGDVFLKISIEKSKCSFWYGANEKNWQSLAQGLDSKYLSTHVAGGFVGSFFALYATSEGIKSDNSAIFKWFAYQGNDETFNPQK